ncbi:hypothetical protein BD626DRAFT_636145 [Schizophyllum amplum]|uniref:Uncharacterized protein n=1 Tax=Schizophyllum amplum TaxID=97359 RepID=A0A550BTV2_9AGAR|nr:hypothetical protein BD626DRAFT_636145 [Auriculariopsis ampla]
MAFFADYLLIPTQTCKTVDSLRDAYTLIVDLVASILMMLRVYAIFGHSRRVLGALSLCLVAAVCLAAWALGPGQEVDPRTVFTTCLSYTPKTAARRLSAAFIALLAYDLVVFVLTLYKTARSVRQPHTPLLRVLLRDGAMYFGVMLLSNIANLIPYYAPGPYLGGSLATTTSSLSVCLVTAATRLSTFVVARGPAGTYDSRETDGSDEGDLQRTGDG